MFAIKYITAGEMLAYMRQSVWMSCVVISAFMAFFFLTEPTLSHSQVYDQFIISQTVTAEISFLATANDVTMSPSIPGLTGGTANGVTQVRVYTNNATGYSMTIAASGTPAMQGVSQGGTIPNYTSAVTGVPDFTFSVGANTGEFGYTVSASTTSDLAQKFLDNGTTCNVGSADTSTSASCWYGLSTTATSTINRTTPTAASGATTTLFFRTQITSNPVPSIAEDIYIATTTLTATTN
jgi:hypothetical protein